MTSKIACGARAIYKNEETFPQDADRFVEIFKFGLVVFLDHFGDMRCLYYYYGPYSR
jgi:hypothetical protein